MCNVIKHKLSNIVLRFWLDAIGFSPFLFAVFGVSVDFVKGEFSVSVLVAFHPEFGEGFGIFISWLVFVVSADPSNTEDEFVDIN